jgi:hypothetical protein
VEGIAVARLCEVVALCEAARYVAVVACAAVAAKLLT